MTTDEMPCVVSQLFDFCRDKGLGKAGQDLFAYDLPDEEAVQFPISVTLMELHVGGRLELLNGTTSMHREMVTLVSRHVTAEEAKRALVPFVKELTQVSGNLVIKGVKYSYIHPTLPIHLAGKDRNNKWVAEVDLAILRKPE